MLTCHHHGSCAPSVSSMAGCSRPFPAHQVGEGVGGEEWPGASPGVISDRSGIEDRRAEVSHLAVDGHPVAITETAAAAPPTAPAAAAAQSFDYRAWRKRLLHARFEKLRAELMDEEYHRIATEVCVPVCPFVPLLPPLPLPLTLTLTR